MYLRSQLLHDVKNLLDVLGVLLPHKVGLLTTHVCGRFSRDFFQKEEGERKAVRMDVSTEVPALVSLRCRTSETLLA